MSTLEGISQPILDLSNVDVLAVLAAFDEGVIITDREGKILFYNETQSKIDDLTAVEVIGQNVVEIYNLDGNSSMILRCIKTGKPASGNAVIILFQRCELNFYIFNIFLSGIKPDLKSIIFIFLSLAGKGI